MKLMLTLLLLLPSPATAAWTTPWTYVKFWCAVVVQKIAPQDPYQYEHLPNNLLVRRYLEVGSKASWANKTSSDLKVLGDQLRWNHELYTPLTPEQLRMLENYKHFEAETDGLTPWAPRTKTRKEPL